MYRSLCSSPSKARAILIYCVVAFFLFFEMALQVSPSVMASQLMHDLSLGVFGLGIMSGVYFYTYTAMQIPSGMLFDKFHPRVIITLAILVCTAGAVLFSFSTSIISGSLARLLMGTGSAFAFVSVLVVTADLFEAKYFATITGVTQMLAALGAMSGQMPISLLVTSIGWRQTLILFAVIGFVLAIIVWLLLHYPKQQTTKAEAENLPGIKAVLASKQTWAVALYACLLWAPMSGFASLWGVPFLKQYDNLTDTSAAFLCSLMWLGIAVASPLLGHYSTQLRNRVKPLYFSALIGAIAFGILLKFHLPPIFLGLLIFIAGGACAGQALSFTVVKENNHAVSWGTAIAINNMAVVISGAIFQPLIGKLIEHFSARSMPLGNAYQYALISMFAVYLAAWVVARFFIKESYSA